MCPLPTALGDHSIPRARLVGWIMEMWWEQGTALPFSFECFLPCWRKQSIISLTHRRQLPLGALHLHTYTDANVTPRKFSAFASRSKACCRALTFFSIPTGFARVDPALGHPGQDLGCG